METVNTNTQAGKLTAQMAFWEKMEFNRFSIIPILLTLIGCLGGLCASFGASGSTLKLAMLAFPTIIALALMLAVAPMRIIVWTSALAIVLDILVLIF